MTQPQHENRTVTVECETVIPSSSQDKQPSNDSLQQTIQKLRETIQELSQKIEAHQQEKQDVEKRAASLDESRNKLERQLLRKRNAEDWRRS